PGDLDRLLDQLLLLDDAGDLDRRRRGLAAGGRDRQRGQRAEASQQRTTRERASGSRIRHSVSLLPRIRAYRRSLALAPRAVSPSFVGAPPVAARLTAGRARSPGAGAARAPRCARGGAAWPPERATVHPSGSR